MTARHHTESSGLKHHLRRCLVSKSATAPPRFASPAGLDLEASFDGGRLTSAGGLPWLDEAERATGICASFAQLIPDWRRRGAAPLDRGIDSSAGVPDRLRL